MNGRIAIGRVNGKMALWVVEKSEWKKGMVGGERKSEWMNGWVRERGNGRNMWWVRLVEW